MDNNTIQLLDRWLLHQLSLLQHNYHTFLREETWDINLTSAALIKFTQNVLSKKYLELFKYISSPTSKKTLLFVYQQLLVMFHPIIPAITNFIYQHLTQEEILNATFIKVEIESKQQEELWQVDCCFAMIETIRSIHKQQKDTQFYLELLSSQKTPFLNFDWNFFLQALLKSNVVVVNPINKKELVHVNARSVSLFPFGALYVNENKKVEVASLLTQLQKELQKHEAEYQRSADLLSNKGFVARAPTVLLAREKQKIEYHHQQKDILLQQIKKIEEKKNLK